MIVFKRENITVKLKLFLKYNIIEYLYIFKLFYTRNNTNEIESVSSLPYWSVGDAVLHREKMVVEEAATQYNSIQLNSIQHNTT